MRAAGALAIALFVATNANAQLSAQDKALADAFFNDGVKLLRAGKVAEACPKLAESERIDPAVGTALYLGDCFVRLEKIASAQAMFQEAYDYAVRRGDARATVAKEKHDKLRPSTLTITAANGAVIADLAVSRDGATVSTLQLGVALPVDGGSHVVEARAPSHEPFSKSVNVPNQEGSITITIPKLREELAPPVVVVTTPTTPRGGGMRMAGLVTAGVGLVTLAVGGTAGIIATLDWNASNSVANGCNSGTTFCPGEHGVDLRSSAESWATVSTVMLITGGVIAVAGAIVYLIAPRARPALGYIVPTVGPGSGGFVAGGRF
jgi:hypothetical protein